MRSHRHIEIDVEESRKRRRERIIIVVLFFVVVLATFLESYLFRREDVLSLPNNVFIFGLININIILIIFLVFLIVRNVVKLIYERRHGIIGSKLRTKLVTAFVSLSLIPTVFLFLIATNFLSYNIDNWFNIKIGDTLNKTLEIARLYYQQTAEHAKHYARQISSDITKNRLYERERTDYLRTLIEQRQESYRLGIVGVYFDNREENLIIKDRGNPDICPLSLSPKILEDIFVGKETSAIQSSDVGDLISGLTPIYSYLSPKEVIGVVVVSYYIPKSLVDKMAAISKTSERYRQLHLLKNPIKLSYIIILFIVTLLIIFSATWFGLFLAKGITVPIQDLAEATRKIAQGNLDYRINIKADDEIGILVDSFNQMTEDLKKSNKDLEQANIDLDQRRKYMETILRNVSAGIVSVDKDGVITTVNSAAEKMLGIKTEKVLNRCYRDVLYPEHMVLVNELLREMRVRGDDFVEKQIELALKDGKLMVLTTVTVIKDDDNNDLGMVVVFEDLTQLQMAERAAAWREVARRIAHEIKNPLTPVQLSAQRLQKKYGAKLGDDDPVFYECTRTIINQVEVMRKLVNEFSLYARMPVTNLFPNDLNETIRDSVLLFQDAHKDIHFDLQQGTDIPKLNLDPEQIKRVMINLLDNAVAAAGGKDGRIEIRTSYDETQRRARVEVADNGPGIPAGYKMKMFEPYFSTKRSGTGLGLAIVNSIISDHHGHVSVRDNSPTGTIIAIELPVTQG
ncbi:MAG: ATP-binding protein [Syntrophales bacterium]|nr:ATP-binding protein [Syntrophales bacterium]